MVADFATKIYGLAGPKIGVGPYAGIRVFDLESPRGTCDWDWEHYAGIEATFGGELKVFGMGWEYTATLVDARLLSATRSDCGTGLVEPERPWNVRVLGRTVDSIEVAWDGPIAAGYRVVRVYDPGLGPDHLLSKHFTVSETGYQDRGLVSDREYCYIVRAVVGGVESAESERACGRTRWKDISPPSSPTGLSAEAKSSRTISLRWETAVDDVGVDRYVVSEWPDGANTRSEDVRYLGTTEDQSFDVAGLRPDTNYCLGVVAMDEAGNASLGAFECATTKSDQAAPPLPLVEDASAAEGEPLAFEVRLDRHPEATTTYWYATHESTAYEGLDYEGVSATALTFAVDQASTTVTVSTTGDSDDEGDEQLHLYVADAEDKLARGLPTNFLAQATGTIIDDDVQLPSPRIADASAEEGEPLIFEVTLDRSPAAEVTYQYATYQDTARGSGVDYSGAYATPLTFRAGQTSATIAVQTTEDDEVEENKQFHVYLADAASKLTARLPTEHLARATGTILDDDGSAAKPGLQGVSDARAVEGDWLQFTVTLDRDPVRTETYWYATYADSATGGEDDYYGSFATALTFGAGERSKTVSVQSREDTDDEGDERFYVCVADAQSKLTQSRPSGVPCGAGTIEDDDASAPAVQSVSDPSAEEGEWLAFTVTLDSSPSSTATFWYATYADSATGGNDDYYGSFATALTFGAGERSKTVSVQSREDTDDEGDERFYLCVADAQSKLTTTRPSGVACGAGTILDDDAASAPAVQSVSDASAEEGEWLAFTVTLDRSPPSSSTFWYATYADSATGGNDDYYGSFATALTFGAGEQSKTVSVQSREDSDDESDERFYLCVADAQSKLTQSRPTGVPCGAGTILDDDAAATAPAVQSVSGARAEEGDLLRFTVTLDRSPSSSATFWYATYADSATGGNDDYYGVLATALTFGAGERSKTVSVQSREDSDDEGNEQFYLCVADAQSKLTTTRPSGVTCGAGTIVDDDGATTPTVQSVSDASAEEGDWLAFTVTLDRAPSSSATFWYATYADTATGGDVDYYGSFATALTFGAGERTKTVSVQSREDSDDEGDERFYLCAADAQSDLTQSRPSGVPCGAGTIRDDDDAVTAPTVQSVSNASAEEGDWLAFTVTLDRAPSSSATFWYATYADTATGGDVDYYGSFATALTFGAGERTKTVSVQSREDSDDEGDERFYLCAADAQSDLTQSRPSGVPCGAGTIQDDDGSSAPDLVVSSASLRDSSVEQGDSARIYATVQNTGNASAGSSRVSYSVRRGGTTTKLDDDYVSSLSAGASSDENEYLDTDDLEVGTYTVIVEADYEGDVDESNESNNTHSSLQLTVTAPAMPDLVVSALSVDDSTVEQGDRVRVRATVKNQGNGRASSSRVRYGVMDTGGSVTWLDYDYVSSLSAGASSDENEYLDTDDLEVGTYTVLALADYTGSVDESDEGNNLYDTVVPLTVTAP